MPVTSMPAVDQQIWGGWTENQRTLYHSYDYFMVKATVARMKTWALWQQFCGKIRWKPNMGPTMKAVITVPSPHIRQFAFPQPMSSTPKKDVMDVREREEDVIVYRHKFESPIFNFYPAFNDTMDHIDDNSKDIDEKIMRFSDIYLRGSIFHMAPFMFVAKADGTVAALDNVPYWAGDGAKADTDGKTTAFMLNAIAQATGTLGLAQLAQAVSIAENDLRIPFFKGGTGKPTDDAPLSGMYAFVTSGEFWQSLTTDPYLLANKNCDLDVVNQSFKGRLFGRVTCKLEDLPLRCTNAAVFNAPELRQEAESTPEHGETVPNPEYALIANSPYEIGFLVGAQGYDSIELGPPPAKFTGNTPPRNFPGMDWNGKVHVTKNFLITAIDSDTGSTVYDTNDDGEYLKLKAAATYGILPKQRRNIIPILYKRKRIAG